MTSGMTSGRSLLDIVANDPKFTDSRKASLYSNFQRLRETNEYGFTANLAAWEGVLSKAVANKCFENQTTLDTVGLMTGLTDSKNGTPLALNVVIDDMVAKQKLVPLAIWLNSTSPLLRSQWSVKNALSGVGSWAWSKIFNTAYSSGSAGKLKPLEYVAVDAVKKIANDLLKSLQHKSKVGGGTITSKVFDSHELGLSNVDLQVCVTYLNRELQKDICFDSENDLVVLAPELSEEFQTIADIHRQMAVLSARTQALQSKVQTLDQRARTAVALKQMQVAKQHLRSKQGAEKSLGQTLSLYTQLETVLNNVDIASDQSTAIDVLEKSHKLLKSVNSTVGSADKAAKLMDDISDGIAETEEISNELGRISLDGIEDAEIEDELEELERQETTAKIGKLPNVPSSLPDKTAVEPIKQHESSAIEN